MPDSPQTPKAADSPQLAHYKSRERELIEKGKRLAATPSDQGFDREAAIARNEFLLKEVRAAMKEAK